MRIIVFNRHLHTPAGTERMTTLLANYLDDCNHKIFVLTLQNLGNPFFKLNDNVTVLTLLPDHNNNIIDLPSHFFKCLKRYKKLLKNVKPDLVIDLGLSLSLLSLPLSKLYNFKVISWEHFNTFVNWHTRSSKIARWLASKLSHRVVVLTELDRHHFKITYNAKNVVCIQNPITIDNEAKPKPKTKNVLAIGRLTEQKGFTYLLKAWKMVMETSPDWKLIIVGDGELKNDLLAESQQLGLTDHIDFDEPTHHIDEYYRNASIFAMSSLFEGLPLVLLEAKSFGLPIVSFNCKTGPDVIIRNNTDGFLVPVGDVQALANKILLLMEDAAMRKTFSANALADKRRFSVEEFQHSWDELLNTV